MTTAQFIGIDVICLVMLALVVYFTRATPRRVAGAVIGGILATCVGVVLDVIGDRIGSGHYTLVRAPYGPLPMYVAVALWYGMTVQLIGWRIARRFGFSGLVGFIAFMSAYGPARDYVGIALTQGRVQV